MSYNFGEEDKLIGEFMGHKNLIVYGEEYAWAKDMDTDNIKHSYYKISFYHEDWNYLMQVVDKISEIYNQADEKFSEAIRENKPMILEAYICGPSKEVIYYWVVEFIKWYNQYLKNL